MDGLIAYALAKKYADVVGQRVLSAGFKVQVEQDRSVLNGAGQEKIMYFLPKTVGSTNDGYDEFIYAQNAWEWVGKTDIDLSGKLNKAQGSENAGKFLVVGNDGDITLLTLQAWQGGDY